ncbi:ATP-dependent Lon protease [Indivirus ILV1]|uniref:ATP-dependent Lon protease n=1 Tax=Indivirus ILV1 TaxID=1977633 RepID=A0A1V0SCN1_9VIRU|nr:ATP-dependent Lon protease [Indivirus ILV1]
MGEIAKDIKINNLIEEYARYSDYLFHFQKHIEKCYISYIIDVKKRNSYLKIINDMIRQLNTIYNQRMVSICENDDTMTNLIELDKYATLTNTKEVQDLINIHKLIGVNGYVDQFENIKNIIINKLSSVIGFPSIKIALSILIGFRYKYIFDSETNNKLTFFNKVFTPLKYKTNEIKVNNIIIEKISNSDEVDFYILENYCNIYIDNIILTGFFSNDSLNLLIRTSQLCNNDIYQKKKDIENYVLTRNEINTKFVKSYMRNVSICDIITLDENSFNNKIMDDYQKYNSYVKLSFINLMKEFVKNDNNPKSCISNMFTMIKLLLIGSDESINIAGLLFGITKEKKIESEFSISDIIYNNLSYLSQIKLRKTTFSIKSEIDRIKSISTDDIDLKKQIIVKNNMPDSVKKLSFEKIEEMKSANNNEYYKQLLYVKTLLNFPWPSSDDDTYFIDVGKGKDKGKQFLESITNKLNNKVYGHNECKSAIKELIGKWICNPASSGSAVGLAGPPGVGKTLIAKEIGNALGIPFVQITLGGQNDGELLHGHGYTYSGSQPGMIVKKMVEAGSARCIMYFDELDKACKKYDNNEIYNILIHITDPNTNTEFQDRFFQEVKFPLNKVLFIFSYNDSSLIDNILMDRINEIEVKPFKPTDKKVIVHKFLINEMCELVGFEKDSILIDDDVIDFIVEHYTNEPGVRDLKRKLEKIFLKLNIDRIYNTNLFEKINQVSKENPIKLTKEIVENYLGKNNSLITKIHNEPLVGVINGLYATDRGHGGILPIQVYDNYTAGDECKFTLKLTGNQKKIMQESVIAAFTTAINNINNEIRDEYIKKHPGGLHIHCPGSAATPKDGPSAGIVFAISFISRILNKKIKNDVAATGEIELTGKISKIGGLQYKLPGAKKAGVRLVLVSSENEDDINDLKKEYPDLFDDTFKVILIKNVRDALEHALVDYDSSQIS